MYHKTERYASQHIYIYIYMYIYICTVVYVFVCLFLFINSLIHFFLNTCFFLFLRLRSAVCIVKPSTGVLRPEGCNEKNMAQQGLGGGGEGELRGVGLGFGLGDRIARSKKTTAPRRAFRAV